MNYKSQLKTDFVEMMLAINLTFNKFFIFYFSLKIMELMQS